MFFLHVLNLQKKPAFIYKFSKLSKKKLFILIAWIFFKIFRKKKYYKKKKSIKMLLARYIRKLYLLIKFKHTIFFIKKIPTYLLEIINILNTPIIHKFLNPFSETTVEEPNVRKNIFNINYFIFFKNIDFSNNKTRQKGRIKRKVTRKMILENSIID
uniref:Uncharacterized protein n=1 Tax=Oxytricha trifallax TaxID=1172189 RepID=G9HRH9_9SPIT|nr:hypothetical protein [Oxytricha trifallax]